MGGMPSARGCEWKGRYEDKSHQKFSDAFDRIPRDKDGKMIYEPQPGPIQAPVKPIPKTCGDCFFVNSCEVETAHGSAKCRERLEV